MVMSPSASKIRRTCKVLGMVAACYAAYAVGTAVLITGHELAHFVGGNELPSTIVFAPSERAFEDAHPHGTTGPTLVYYLDNFVAAVTGSVFLDPESYRPNPTDLPAVAAAWLGPIDHEDEEAVTLYPVYLAAIGAALGGLLTLAVPRLPVFTLAMAFGLGGFYSIHHMMEAGLTLVEGTLLAFGILVLYAVPATFAFWAWCKKHVKPRPRRRTFRAVPRVRGYTVMPYVEGVQFIHARAAHGVRGQGLMTRSAQAAATAKPFSTKMAPMTPSSAVARTESRSRSLSAPLPNCR